MSGTSTGRGRGYGLDSSPLRKPASSSRPGSNTSSPKAAKAVHSDSSLQKLNVNATEFVPKLGPTLNPTVQEFVPRAVKSSPNVQCDQPESDIDIQQQVVSTLADFLNYLYQNPGELEECLGDLTEAMIYLLTNVDLMTTACSILYDWAVNQPNFCYTCARLVKYLNERVPNDNNGKILAHMLKKCHNVYSTAESLATKDPKHLQSFAVFMAELYIQIVDVDGNRLDKLRNAIVNLVKIMCEHAAKTESYVKIIIQVMKMCGACLDDDYSRTEMHTRDMDALLANLDKMSNKLSPQLQSSVMRIRDLRKDNWGRSISPVKTPRSESSFVFTNEPIFFDPSGQQITREQAELSYGESAVVQSYATWSDGFDGTDQDYSTSAAGDGNDFAAGDAFDDDDDDAFGDEMTDEMFADFEQFQMSRR